MRQDPIPCTRVSDSSLRPEVGSQRLIELRLVAGGAARPQLDNYEQTGNAQLQAGTGNFTEWLKVDQARHPNRPSPVDFISGIFVDFSEIHGDRAFGDDQAVVCGMARLDNTQLMVIGRRKGNTLKERIKINFGMPHPEGYRKALRCMRIAEKFGHPVISIIDVTAAYPVQVPRSAAKPRPSLAIFAKCRAFACLRSRSSAAKGDRAVRWH